MDNHDYQFETLAVRAGQVRTEEGEHSEPIFLTSSYVFHTAAEAEARFKGTRPGNIYSRFTNPTVRSFEERLAVLEGGESCVATASGMAAILSTCLGLLKAGDHIVSSRSIFGSTVILFNKYLARFGISVTYVSQTDTTQWQQAIQKNTKLLFLETPSNPLITVADIQAIATIAHAHGCLLAVDNCFCTPALQQPLRLGADIVIHSATKYIDGQGRCLGGAVIGDKQRVGEEVFGVIRTAGPSMSPFNAWVFLKGLETLSLRMQAHSARALELAVYLQSHPAVEKVYYPGLPQHPQHLLARKQQAAFGGVLAFEVRGARREAWQVIDNTRLISITANLGDAKSTITHPASTTHGRLSDAERAEAGVRENLIRVAVGLEDIRDLKADLDHGLLKIN
ncbi:MAG: O-succinylhomoserine sulfhydrylase [Gammaproteobacteria bacterium]|nr:O-succinylhomoserine sulfhydrylase [Gammaproteobacteria bacterium]